MQRSSSVDSWLRSSKGVDVPCLAYDLVYIGWNFDGGCLGIVLAFRGEKRDCYRSHLGGGCA